MATITLTAGGKAAPARPNPLDPAILLDRWEKTLTVMLEQAVRYGELDALVKKRRAWLAANPFHDLHAERHTAMWSTTMERNQIGGVMLDRCADLSRLQRDMPPGMIDGLAALLGHPLWPYAGQQWAAAAGRLKTTDIFSLASWVSMEQRSEHEQEIGGVGVDGRPV